MRRTNVYDPQANDDPVVCYLDASATDHERVEHATLGGIVFNRSGFSFFDEQWTDMLERYNLPAIHMNQFTPHGDCRHIVGCQRACLMVNIATLIERFKIYTITASINNQQLREVFSGDITGYAGAYGLSFAAIAIGNHKHASEINYEGDIAYVLDMGIEWARA